MKIREFWPDDYHNYDILDESSRASLILRGFNGLLGLNVLKEVLGKGQFATLEAFMQAYDQLHEHNRFDVELRCRPSRRTNWARPSRISAKKRGSKPRRRRECSHRKPSRNRPPVIMLICVAAVFWISPLSQSEFVRRPDGDEVVFKRRWKKFKSIWWLTRCRTSTRSRANSSPF